VARNRDLQMDLEKDLLINQSQSLLQS